MNLGTTEKIIGITLTLLALTLAMGLSTGTTEDTWEGFIEPETGETFQPGEIPAQVQPHSEADAYRWEIVEDEFSFGQVNGKEYTFEIEETGTHTLKTTAEKLICVDEPHISPEELKEEQKDDFCRKEFIPIESDTVSIQVGESKEEVYFKVTEVETEDTYLGQEAVTEALIKNTGETKGTQDIELLIHDSEPGEDPLFNQTKEKVEIKAGESKLIEFSEEVPTEEKYVGEYKSTVSSEDSQDTDQFEIKNNESSWRGFIEPKPGETFQPGEIPAQVGKHPNPEVNAYLWRTDDRTYPATSQTNHTFRIEEPGQYTLESIAVNMDIEPPKPPEPPWPPQPPQPPEPPHPNITTDYQEESTSGITPIEKDTVEIEVEEEKEEYELKINSTKGGNVTEPGEGRFEYENNTVVNITAGNNQGYEFMNWTGNTSTIEDPESPETKITIRDNYTITANFKEKPVDQPYFEINITSPTDGTEYEEDEEIKIEHRVINKGGVEDTQNITFAVDEDNNVEEKEKFTLKSNETEENSFTWTADEEGTYELIISSEDHTDTVEIIVEEDTGTGGGGGGGTGPSPTTYDLTINTEGEGEISPGIGTYTYTEGTEVEVEATPEEGWYFQEWTGDHTSTEEEITVTMDEDKEITAHFQEEIENYTLTTNIDGEGEVEINPEQDEYEEGTEVTLTAEAQEDHEFTEWTGDHTGTEEEITITMNEDKEITAHFTEKEPYFEIVRIEHDEEVTEGEETTIEIRIENTGEATGAQTITLHEQENPENMIDSREITLEEGEETTVNLNWETEQLTTGEHTLTVSSGDQEINIEISIVEAEEPEEPTTITGLVTGAFANPVVGIIALIALIIASMALYKRENIKKRLKNNLEKEE